MAAIVPQEASGGGVLDVTFAAANAGGDTVISGHRAGGHSLNMVYLLVKNAHSADWVVTVDGTAYTVPFGAGKVAMLPVGRGVYAGSVAVTYSGVTALTVGAVRVTQ